MTPTVWVMVAMVYLANGDSKKCYASVEFPDFSSCYKIESKVNYEWIMARKGWSMCVPKDTLKSDVKTCNG